MSLPSDYTQVEYLKSHGTDPTPITVSDSILLSVKKYLGIDRNYTEFDLDILTHINSVFVILYQMGVGPKEVPFWITDENNTWEEFETASGITNGTLLPVRSYMFCKVKLIFDPPVSSTALTSIEKYISEFEWRLNIEHDDTYPEKPADL